MAFFDFTCPNDGCSYVTISAKETNESPSNNCQCVYLMRHGERLDNIDVNWIVNNPYYFDPPLSNYGLNLSKEITSKLNLKSLLIERIISSPFCRTIQTAYNIAKDLNIKEITISYGMSEVINANSGIDSQPSIDLNQQLLPFKDVEFTTYGECNLPNYPESTSHCLERYSNTIYALANLYWPTNILISTHAFALRSACHIFSSMPINGDIPFFGVIIGKRYSIADNLTFNGTLNDLKIFSFSKC